MATCENLFSMQDARNLIRHGGMRSDRDWLQFDGALSYGLVLGATKAIPICFSLMAASRMV
jgi:hypothetical protein